MTSLAPPRIILLDWHGTLVDTSRAMYRAMDEMLGRLDLLGIAGRLVEVEQASREDRELVRYVRAQHKLPGYVIAQARISRTDLLEIMFGEDRNAKNIANDAYNDCYRHHYGAVRPLQPGVRDLLFGLRDLGIRLGIVTNRAREFLDKELETIEHGAWRDFFESTVSGSDCRLMKPSPGPILHALRGFEAEAGSDTWYVGDSVSDTLCAKGAGVTSIFFAGDLANARRVEAKFADVSAAACSSRPDWVVVDYQDLLELVRKTLSRAG